MSDSSGSGKQSGAPDLMRGASPQMLKTVGLLLAAFILGVVMLNVIDDGSTSSTKKPPSTTTTHAGKGSHNSTTTSSTTPKTTAKQLAPAQIHLIVLNASGVNHVAANVSSAIRGHGYTSQETAETAPATRKGSAVQCRPGLTREANALVLQVGNKSKVEPFPGTLPKLKSGTSVPATVQCIVIIGTVK